MRRWLAITAGAAVLAAGLAPGAATAEPGATADRQTAQAQRQRERETTPAEQAALVATDAAREDALQKQGKPLPPRGPNPHLALLPEPAGADRAGWDRFLAAKGEQRAQRMEAQRLDAGAGDPLLVEEEEPAGERGGNDRPVQAQLVRELGTSAKTNHRALLLGTLSPAPTAIDDIPPSSEDDGAISLARDTGIGAERDGVTVSGEIGDGPHGSAGSGSGDLDFYRIEAGAGDTLAVDIDTPESGDSLDPMLAVYDSAGEMVAFDDDSHGLDSYLETDIPADGAYYVMVTGFPVLPDDPFDSASGSGAGSEGTYALAVTLSDRDAVDVDFYAVRLRKGDVLGASVEGAAARLAVHEATTVLAQRSSQDLTWVFPAETPLPGGGNAVVDHVAERAGLYYVGVSQGDGDYRVTLEAYRPALETRRPVQTLFVDLDGARLNTAVWGGPGVRTLSPLRAFLGRWGLTSADEDRLIDETMDVVRENIRHDLVGSGVNPRFGLMVKNSRDHADTFGQRNVSRVVVGGTIAQAGIETIGIAESVDPGNFGTQESALVLLDLLSAPAGPDYSLNTYLGPEGDRVGFVAQGLGNVIAHEAGHFFGGWHVDPHNDDADLMDTGGNFAQLFGVGPDGIGGTADDEDVDFGEDVFDPREGFRGTQDSLSRVALVLTR